MFDDLVNNLNMTVGLRMVNWKEVFLDTEFVVEFSELFNVELGTIIRDDLLRCAVSTYYYLPYKILDFFAGDRGKWFGFGPLGEIIDSDHSVLEGRSCYG